MANNGGVVVVVAGQDNTEQVFKQIEANLLRTREQANSTGNALAEMGEKGMRALQFFGAAIAVREVAGALTSTVKSALDFGTEIQKASQKTGLAVGTLSTLHYAAALTNSDFEGLSGAVAKLDKSIGTAADGNKKAEGFLNAIGLSASSLVNRSDGAEVAFRQLAQTIAATENPIRRVELATGLLGKAGAEQIDTLVKVGSNWDYYKQKAAEAGVQLDGQTAAALAHSNAQLRDMQQRLQGAGLAFTQGLIPGINAMLSVITGGKSQMDAFTEFGSLVGRGLAVATGELYAMARAYYVVKAAALNLKGDSTGADAAYDQAGDLQKKINQAQSFAMNGYAQNWKESTAEHRAESATAGGGRAFTGTGDTAGADRLDAAKKARAAAQLKLDEQAAQLRADAAKDASERALAQLESDHKLELVSDQDFYAKKLALQLDAIEKQKQAAIDKQADIDKNISGLQSDAKRKGGVTAVEDEAKILDLQTRRLAIVGQIAKLDADAAKATTDAALASIEAGQKQLALSDELAAKREEISGGSVSARQKQSADAYAIKRRGLVTNFGANSSEVANADADEADSQGQIAARGAESTSNTQSVAIAAQKAAVQDEERKGVISTAEARQQLIALDKEEAAALQPVLAAYRQLAASGDLSAANKVVELQAQISQLQAPVDEVAAHMREQFDSVFETMFDNIGKGKKGWEDLEKSIQKMAMTDAYKSFVEPLVQNAAGALIPNGRGSGSATGAGGVAGGIGSVLGALIPGVGKLPGISKAVGGGSGDVTVQIINQGTPMDSGGATQQQMAGGSGSDESQFTQRVISVILKDAEQNGSGIQAILGAISQG